MFSSYSWISGFAEGFLPGLHDLLVSKLVDHSVPQACCCAGLRFWVQGNNSITPTYQNLQEQFFDVWPAPGRSYSASFGLVMKSPSVLKPYQSFCWTAQASSKDHHVKEKKTFRRRHPQRSSHAKCFKLACSDILKLASKQIPTCWSDYQCLRSHRAKPVLFVELDFL